MKPFGRFIISCLTVLIPAVSLAQYAPAVGQPGTTAIFKDSAVLVAWATQCQVERGWQHIADTSFGLATTGDSSMALGPAGPGGVVSLGDGGRAVVQFDYPVVNGPGWDFAVFENAFDDYFLELAFVEVSSNGQDYFRFPAHSLTDTNEQVNSFDSLDASKLNNLAGKYRGFYGTPFDLEELDGAPGLDVNYITHIRISDVVGCIAGPWATYDTAGRPVNDPFPTPFASGGFDLDAVGVIWNTFNARPDAATKRLPLIFPNPSHGDAWLDLRSTGLKARQVEVFGLNGILIHRFEVADDAVLIPINASGLTPAVYLLKIISENTSTTIKWIVAP